jgi:hypothetical protein
MSFAPSARSGKGASRTVRNRLLHWPAAVVMVEGINSAANVKLEPCAEEVVCVDLPLHARSRHMYIWYKP